MLTFIWSFLTVIIWFLLSALISIALSVLVASRITRTTRRVENEAVRALANKFKERREQAVASDELREILKGIKLKD